MPRKKAAPKKKRSTVKKRNAGQMLLGSGLAGRTAKALRKRRRMLDEI